MGSGTAFARPSRKRRGGGALQNASDARNVIAGAFAQFTAGIDFGFATDFLLLPARGSASLQLYRKSTSAATEPRLGANASKSLVERGLTNWQDQRNWQEFFETYWRLIWRRGAAERIDGRGVAGCFSAGDGDHRGKEYHEVRA